MTTFTIPADQILRHVHRIARRNSLGVDLIDRGPGWRLTPFRFTLAITRSIPDAPDGRAAVVACAFEGAAGMAEAIRQVWQEFVAWGITA